MGRVKRRAIDEKWVGHRFGRLTVMKRARQNSGWHPQWRCLCRCGERVTVRGDVLRAGLTKSCGCLREGR